MVRSIATNGHDSGLIQSNAPRRIQSDIPHTPLRNACSLLTIAHCYSDCTVVFDDQNSLRLRIRNEEISIRIHADSTRHRQGRVNCHSIAFTTCRSIARHRMNRSIYIHAPNPMISSIRKKQTSRRIERQ